MEAPVILATVSSDPHFHKDVRASLDGNLRFEAAWDLSYEDFARLLGIGAEEKCLLIVDFSDVPLALPVARAVDGRPQISSIAVKGGGSREELLQLMQMGVRDVLANFTERDLRQAASRAASNLACAGDALADLYSFMPAKPGCGATTVATYATAMAAQQSAEPTLLLDFDIRLGVTSFLLKAEGIHTIADALLQSEHLDVDIWSSLVARLGNLHLLGSGPIDFSRQVPAERYARSWISRSAAIPWSPSICQAPWKIRNAKRCCASKRIYPGVHPRHRRAACGAPQSHLAAGPPA